MDRRNFLKTIGAAVGTAAVGSQLASCGKSDNSDLDKFNNDDYKEQQEPATGKMTYRTTPSTGDKVSILGYGMMRLPMMEKDENDPEAKDVIDQEQVNKLVDYAMEHGVNYYDTSPVYCQGMSERATGIALKRHPRDKFYVATKLSNFSEPAWSKEGAIAMYRNSMKELQVDYIDYYLLHSVGGGGMETLHNRYLDSGIMSSSVAFYNFGAVGQNEIDNLVSGYNYSNTIASYVEFMNEKTSFALGDDKLVIFKGDQKPEKVFELDIQDEEVLSVFNNKEYIGLIFSGKEGEPTYRIDVFDADGNKVMTQFFDLEYTDVLFHKDLMVIYNANECLMYNMQGLKKYEGNFKDSAITLIPTNSKTRFLLVSGTCMEEIQLK